MLISLVGCCCCDGFCCCWFPCCCCCVLLWLATCWCCYNLKITSTFFCGLPYDSVIIVDYTAVIVGQLLTEELDMEEAGVTRLNMVTNLLVGRYFAGLTNDHIWSECPATPQSLYGCLGQNIIYLVLYSKLTYFWYLLKQIRKFRDSHVAVVAATVAFAAAVAVSVAESAAAVVATATADSVAAAALRLAAQSVAFPLHMAADSPDLLHIKVQLPIVQKSHTVVILNVRTRKFLLLQNVRTNSWAHTASIQCVPGALSPVKVTEACGWPLTFI